MCADDGQVTLLLKAMKNGDKSAAEKLLPLVYQRTSPVSQVLYATGAIGPHTTTDGPYQ